MQVSRGKKPFWDWFHAPYINIRITSIPFLIPSLSPPQSHPPLFPILILILNLNRSKRSRYPPTHAQTPNHGERVQPAELGPARRESVAENPQAAMGAASARRGALLSRAVGSLPPCARGRHRVDQGRRGLFRGETEEGAVLLGLIRGEGEGGLLVDACVFLRKEKFFEFWDLESYFACFVLFVYDRWLLFLKPVLSHHILPPSFSKIPITCFLLSFVTSRQVLIS